MITKKEPKLARVRIDRLVPFPEQGDIFPRPSDAKIAAQAGDIKNRKLQQRVEVLPKNSAGLHELTILSGHSRILAMKLNGEEKASVRIRYDLADAPLSEIRQYVIKENLARRQLTPLGQARAVRKLYEAEKNRESDKLTGREAEQARDRVGDLVGMSGRNLNRYWRVLETPIAVQEALEQKAVSLKTAEKVADLPADVQQGIAKKIRHGRNPKEVIENYLGKNVSQPQTRKAAVSGSLRLLAKVTAEAEH